MEPGLDRALGDAERLGDLRQADRGSDASRARPVARREPSEAAFQLVAVRQLVGRIAGGRRSSGSTRICSAARPDGLVVAGVDEQPLEPGLEAVGVAQAWRSRQARMRHSWTASSVRSMSRRMRCASA